MNHRRQGFAVLTLLFALVASAVPWSETVAQEPVAEIKRMEDLGYNDVTVRGRSVSSVYFVSGPGDYALAAEGSSIELVYSSSELVTTGSVATVLWNGIPLGNRLLTPRADRQTWSIPIPADRIDPSLNRLQIQASLHLIDDTCSDAEDQARYLTIYRTTTVRYALADRQPRPAALEPDLSRYPWPFFEANPASPADVVFILPADPSQEVLEAAAGVSAQLGQFAGLRPLTIRAAQDTGSIGPDLANANLIYVGALSGLPGLQPPASAELRRTPQGLAVPGEDPPAPDTGIILEYVSPANPARMVLAVTGGTDAAVLKAGRTLSARISAKLLGGPFVYVKEVVPGRSLTAGEDTITTRLEDLGRVDDTVIGVGDHALSFTLPLAGSLTGRLGVPLELVLSHSPLLDRERSSARVVVNSIPVYAVRFKDLPATRGVLNVDLPLSALRPGDNAVEIQFSLYLPWLGRLDNGQEDCSRIPFEQAWAVLHGASAFKLPATLGTPAEVTLANYPYPFVDKQRMDQTAFVTPVRIDRLGGFLQLAADLGRTAQGEWLTPRVIPAAEFKPGGPDANLVLWGTPADNPAIAALGSYLPLLVRQEQQERFILSDELRMNLREDVDVGILQVIPSPWMPNRYVLVVSATSEQSLPLAVRALNQRGLGGNLALVQPPQPGTPVPVSSTTPNPSSAREQLRITTYSLKPAEQSPYVRRAAPVPLAGLLAGGAGLLALILALVLAYNAFILQTRGR
jgi:hypothetical protein